MSSSFIIPDDESFTSNSMGIFDDEDTIAKDLNPFHDVQTTILDTEFVEEREYTDPLNEHINIQTFKEVTDVIEEDLSPFEEVETHESVVYEETPIIQKEEKKVEVSTLSQEETAHSLSILEKRLGIELSSLSQEKRDFILTEISDIVINSLDGLKKIL